MGETQLYLRPQQIAGREFIAGSEKRFCRSREEKKLGGTSCDKNSHSCRSDSWFPSNLSVASRWEGTYQFLLTMFDFITRLPSQGDTCINCMGTSMSLGFPPLKRKKIPHTWFLYFIHPGFFVEKSTRTMRGVYIMFRALIQFSVPLQSLFMSSCLHMLYWFTNPGSYALYDQCDSQRP